MPHQNYHFEILARVNLWFLWPNVQCPSGRCAPGEDARLRDLSGQSSESAGVSSQLDHSLVGSFQGFPVVSSGFQWFPVARFFGLWKSTHGNRPAPSLWVWWIVLAGVHIKEESSASVLVGTNGAKTCVLFASEIFQWRDWKFFGVHFIINKVHGQRSISGSLGQSTRKAYVPASYFILEELASSLSELVASLEYPWIGPPDRRPISARMFLVISCHLHPSTFAKCRCHREHRTHVTAVTAEIPRRLLLPRPPGEVAGKDDLHPSETS